MGRTTAFNATLFFTATFGLLAALVGTFKMLAFALFLLGSAVGVSLAQLSKLRRSSNSGRRRARCQLTGLCCWSNCLAQNTTC